MKKPSLANTREGFSCYNKTMKATENLTVDNLITAITEASTDTDAHQIIATTPALLVCEAADQLYVEGRDDGHGIKWLRNAVVKEARS